MNYFSLVNFFLLQTILNLDRSLIWNVIFFPRKIDLNLDYVLNQSKDFVFAVYKSGWSVEVAVMIFIRTSFTVHGYR